MRTKNLYLEGGSSFEVFGVRLSVQPGNLSYLFQIEAACGHALVLLFTTLSKVAEHRMQLFI